MKIITGNLLDIDKGIVVHGVNCMGAMGSGVALQIKRKYPYVFERYEALVESYDDPGRLLGGIQVVPVTESLLVINAFTQLSYGTHQQQVDYNALRTCFKLISEVGGQDPESAKIYYPKIGAGLGGGDWKVISPIIEAELNGRDHYLVELS